MIKKTPNIKMNGLNRRFLRYSLQEKHYPISLKEYIHKVRKDCGYSKLSRKDKKRVFGTCKSPSYFIKRRLFNLFMEKQQIAIYR